MKALVKRERARGRINETGVSEPLKTSRTLPSDEELFGVVIEKLG